MSELTTQKEVDGTLPVMKRFRVERAREQWEWVVIEATSKEEALEIAENDKYDDLGWNNTLAAGGLTDDPYWIGEEA